MKHIIIILSALIVFSSCIKKVNSEGIVYSKSGHRLSNVTVTLLVYTSGMDEALPNPYNTTTDQNGHFMFSEIVAKNSSFGLDVTNGKEWFHRELLGREDLKHYDIHLH
jgi:PBP1b-binding outer membrane lipoprotein LpoB